MLHSAELTWLRAVPPLRHFRSGGRALLLTLIVLGSNSAEAQGVRPSSAPSWLWHELQFAQQSSASTPPAQTHAPEPQPPSSLLESDARGADLSLTASLEAQRGRYRTMRVAGYLTAATSLVLTLAAIPLMRSTREHTDYYGRDSCGANTFPFFAAAGFAAGLGVGITGTIGDRELVRRHGEISSRRARWRAALAGIGTALGMMTLAGSLVASNFCSS